MLSGFPPVKFLPSAFRVLRFLRLFAAIHPFMVLPFSRISRGFAVIPHSGHFVLPAFWTPKAFAVVAVELVGGGRRAHA